jgi:membrane protease YdiL (CAAX protease family)
MSAKLRNENGQLWLPLRPLWNDDERRPRAPIRLVVGIVLVLTLANTGKSIQPSVLAGDGPITEVMNTLIGGVPQAAGIILGVTLVALVLDRRILPDLGLNFRSGVCRSFTGGLALGFGITSLSIAVGVVVGFYEIGGIQMTGGPAVWILLVLGTAISQLVIVVAEEFLVRGYIITNVLEGLDGFPSIPRSVAAGVAVVIASLFFYATHSTRGEVFGLMAGGLAVLLGVAYVLSGDLAVPIGIHFGVNFAGMIGGSAPQQATLVQVMSPTTVAESLVLPGEAVVVRLFGAAIGIGLLLWWYRSVNGQIQIVPEVARPRLRWERNSDSMTE